MLRLKACYFGLGFQNKRRYINDWRCGRDLLVVLVRHCLDHYNDHSARFQPHRWRYPRRDAHKVNTIGSRTFIKSQFLYTRPLESGDKDSLMPATLYPLLPAPLPLHSLHWFLPRILVFRAAAASTIKDKYHTKPWHHRPTFARNFPAAHWCKSALS